MPDFKNVTVIKKANIFFDGKVASHSVLFADGTKKTLGVMQPGEYEFDTASKEIMEILSGSLLLQLPDSSAWREVKGGESFEVPARSKFKMKVSVVTDYVCSFVGH